MEIVTNGDVSLETLYAWSDELAQKWWSRSYTDTIQLTNRRWARTNGRFWASIPVGVEKISFIEFSRKRNAGRTMEEVKGTLLHELVHWHLFTSGKPHRDSDREFVEECLRVGAPISQSIRAQAALDRFMASANNSATMRTEANE
jgi:SprT-like protein